MGRTTVGDVVVDGLLRAGAARIVTVGAVFAGALAGAARRLDVAPVPVESPPAACAVAAVAARLADAPAAVALPGGALAEAGAALAHAAADRAPLIVVTDAAPAVSAKGVVTVEPASAAHWTAHALQLAQAEPPGPVVLVAPAAAMASPAVPLATGVRPPPPPAPSPAALDALARAIAGAERPVAVAGRECRRRDAPAWLRAFAEALPVPVVVTPSARGALPDPHPLTVGVLGSAAAAAALGRSDLIVALGVDAAEAAGPPWPPGVSVASAGRTPLGGAAASAQGDVAVVLEELAPRLRDRARPDWDVAEIEGIRRAAVAAPVSRVGRLAAVARDVAPAGVVACADPACAADVAAGWQAVGADDLLLPAAPGLAGFAAAAAVGSRLVRPAAPVVAFAETGAGTAASLEAAARLGLAIVAVVVAGRGSPAPPGVPIADALDETALRSALDRALAARGPVVLEARPGAARGTTV